MSRTARKISATDYYHVIMRGVNKMQIFFDRSDYLKFVNSLKRFQEETEVEILAYCLMKNHFHLLIKSDASLMALFVKKLASCYVYYFNKKNGRIGPLFQDRFKSVVIDDDEQLLTVARYIHQNPEKAGVANTSDYEWSSFNAYLEDGSFVSVELLLSMLGGRVEFLRYMCQPNDDECEDVKESLNDIEAKKQIMNLLGSNYKNEMSRVCAAVRKTYISQLLDEGVSAKQIADYTGISTNVVYKLNADRERKRCQETSVPFSPKGE